MGDTDNNDSLSRYRVAESPRKQPGPSRELLFVCPHAQRSFLPLDQPGESCYPFPAF